LADTDIWRGVDIAVPLCIQAEVYPG